MHEVNQMFCLEKFNNVGRNKANNIGQKLKSTNKLSVTINI